MLKARSEDMFKKVTLYTNQLEDMKGFYEYQLGFRIIEEDETSFTLAIGKSQLVFKESQSSAVYHFAFNIPGNQFTLAKFWASERVTLNRQEGMDEIYYANFDADAFYFQDPAGNVVEFIARRNVDRMGNFTVDSLLDISEVSITTLHVEKVGELIEKMDIPVRGSKGVDSKTLNFLGSGDTYLILVAPKRTWYFSKQKSEIHPLSIELHDGRQINITEEGQFQQEKPANPIMDKMEEIDFSGVAYLLNNKTWTVARGLADRANSRPNAIDTKFNMGSASKLFTAVAICQLVESGKLDFTDTLSELLPEHFPNFTVTIHQLLTHTSGIPDYNDKQENNSVESSWKDTPMYLMQTASDFISLFNERPMMFEPGEKFYYNHAGFIALGLIVEKITETAFTTVVENQIFDPAGMKNSGYFDLDRLPSQTAFGYIEDAKMWRTNQYAIPIRGSADGGAYVTASDMADFWECLMNGTLMSEDMLKTLLHIHISADGCHYGYGIDIKDQASGALNYSILGNGPGIGFYSAFYPKGSSILTVLSNKTDGASEITETIKALKIEKE